MQLNNRMHRKKEKRKLVSLVCNYYWLQYSAEYTINRFIRAPFSLLTPSLVPMADADQKNNLGYRDNCVSSSTVASKSPLPG